LDYPNNLQTAKRSKTNSYSVARNTPSKNKTVFKSSGKKSLSGNTRFYSFTS